MLSRRPKGCEHRSASPPTARFGARIRLTILRREYADGARRDYRPRWRDLALGCLIPLSRNADLWRSSLSACESQYPAEIHDQIQSENVGIKSLGILDTFRRNVRYDAFYRHAASHTSIR